MTVVAYVVARELNKSMHEHAVEKSSPKTAHIETLSAADGVAVVGKASDEFQLFGDTVPSVNFYCSDKVSISIKLHKIWKVCFRIAKTQSLNHIECSRTSHATSSQR